jgi:predicted GIY-YIG superfamily endonuclease
MSSIFHYAQPETASTSIIYRTSGGITGLREVFDEASNLSVLAFPMMQLDQVARVRPLAFPACYMLTNGSTAYVGEAGNVGRRIAQHMGDSSKNFATEVFVIRGANEFCLDKTVAISLQHHFTNAVERASLVSLLKGRNPQTIELPEWRRTSVDQFVESARRLLFDAGCRALDSSNPPVLLSVLPEISNAPVLAPDDPDENGLLTIGVPMSPDGCDEYQLLYANIWARGYSHDADFIVCAGSEIRIGINQSVNPILFTRRRELAEAGALEAIRGVEDRQRLTISVAFPSAAIAAKVVTGAHANANAWQRRHYSLPMIVAK